MVIKEISKAIATMFGIELKDYNSGIANQEGIYDGIADSADDASDAVKKLKRQTLGFDEIHNINESKDSGTSASGGIDQRLLDAIQGYDNGMNKVRMKATEIRDKWMEILGFHKEIDPLTGEISFKYQGLKTTLTNSWNWFKKLNTQGKLFIGLGLVAVFAKMFTGVKKINKVAGASGLFGITKNLLSPMKSLSGLLKDDLAGGFYKLTDSMSESVTMWSKSLTTMDKFKVGITGILGLSISMGGMADAMKSVSNEGWNLGNSLQTVASGLGGIASSAYIGSIFGPWGTVIGGATGALLTFVSAITGYQTEIDKVAEKTKNVTDSTQKYIDSIKEQNSTIENSTSKQIAVHEYNKKLLDELGLIVDANGKIKKGYEERAEFILSELNTAYGTEYKVVNGVIQQYGSLNKTIKELIKQKEIEILLEGKKQQYADAVQNQYKDYLQYKHQLEAVTEAESKLTDAQNEVTEARKRMQKASNFGVYVAERINLKKAEDSLKNLSGEYDNAKNKLEELKTTVVNNGQIISDYSSLTSASLSGDLDAINRAIENSTTTWIENGKTQKISLSEQMKYLDFQYNVVGKGITEEYYEAQKQDLLDTLVSMSNTTREKTPEIIEAWATLGEKNKDVFLNGFKNLPEKIQQEIVDKMYEKGYNISSELQKGMKEVNQKITFTADTNPINKKINELSSKISEKLNIQKLLNLAPSGVKNVLGNLFKENGGVYSNGSWKNIQQYANGGTPSRGTLFWAGEAGAEVVAHANRKTEVLNQSQIASAIYSATLSAMSQVMSQYGGQSSSIDVHVHTDEGTVVDRINQTTKQTGVCPINIPVY